MKHLVLDVVVESPAEQLSLLLALQKWLMFHHKAQISVRDADDQKVKGRRLPGEKRVGKEPIETGDESRGRGQAAAAGRIL